MVKRRRAARVRAVGPAGGARVRAIWRRGERAPSVWENGPWAAAKGLTKVSYGPAFVFLVWKCIFLVDRKDEEEEELGNAFAHTVTRQCAGKN